MPGVHVEGVDLKGSAMTNRVPTPSGVSCATPPRPACARRRAVRSLAGGSRDRRGGGIDTEGLPAGAARRPSRGLAAGKASPGGSAGGRGGAGGQRVGHHRCSGPTRSSPAHQRSSCTRCRPAARPRCCQVGWPWYRTTRWTTSTRAWRPNPMWSWSRPWLPQTARRKHPCASGSPAGPTEERTCWVCATAAGCSQLRVCLTVAGPPRTGRASAASSGGRPRWTGSAASAMSRTAPAPPPPG